MATGTIALSNIVLIDNWPGLPDLRRCPPQDGFGASNTAENNVTSPAVPLGTKVAAYDKSIEATITFIYLKTDEVLGVSLGKLCGMANEAWTVAIDVANVNSTGVLAGAAAVALGTLTVSTSAPVDYHGWFWCGGPCPQDPALVSAVGGTDLADVTVATSDVGIGNFVELADVSSALALKALGTAGEIPCAFAKAADTDD